MIGSIDRVAILVPAPAASYQEVRRPLVATARPIAAGALMRLEAGRRCCERYREELRLWAVRSAPVRSCVARMGGA